MSLNQKTKSQSNAAAVSRFAPNAQNEARFGRRQTAEVLDGPWRAQPEVLLAVHHDLASLASIWTALEQSGDCTAFQTFAEPGRGKAICFLSVERSGWSM